MYRKLRLFIILVLTIMALLMFIPFLTITELIYPVKIDSVYVRSHQIEMEKGNREDTVSTNRFLYNPSQLGLWYIEWKIAVGGGDSLSAWSIMDSTFISGHHLLLLPEPVKGKLNYIEFADEATGRGLTVHIVELRGQGSSGGNRYLPDRQSALDVKTAIDTLQAHFGFERMVIMGVGLGSAVAMQTARDDERVAALVIENPFLDLRSYLKSYSEKKYGLAGKLFGNRMVRSYYKESGLAPDSVNLLSMISDYHRPVMIITHLSPEFPDYRPALKLYQSSPSSKKSWLVVRKSIDENRKQAAVKKYFDRLAIFVSVNLPKSVKPKPRYQKVA